MELPAISLAAFKVLVVLSFVAFPVSGHGRLWDPPARGTMFRWGFNTPANYNDMGLNCGGFLHQVNLDYKCGICGDPYDGKREHEVGGLYATGTIARTYSQGEAVEFKVQLTANHKGYFEFRICPTNSPDIEATEDCLNQNLLEIGDGGDTKFVVDFIGPRMVNLKVHLPFNLTCTVCVVQWRYHAGNTWGTDPDGTSCLGCGYQEEFYGCSDVSITPGGLTTVAGDGQYSSSSSSSSSTTSPAGTTTTTTTTTTTMSTSTTTTTPPPPPTTTTTTTTTTSATTTATSTTSAQTPTCVGVGPYSVVPGIDTWCVNNCVRGYCPETTCSCSNGGV